MEVADDADADEDAGVDDATAGVCELDESVRVRLEGRFSSTSESSTSILSSLSSR